MGLNVEINGHPSVIVVTLSGDTDLAAVRPLQAALAAALADGQTVVVDLENLAHLDIGVLSELVAHAAPRAGQIRLVSGKAEVPGAIAAPGADNRIQLYRSVAAALADRAAGSEPPAGQGDDLSAKFANLTDQYRTAIDQCRQSLHRLEDVTDDVSARSGLLDPNGAFRPNASEPPGERKPA